MLPYKTVYKIIQSGQSLLDIFDDLFDTSYSKFLDGYKDNKLLRRNIIDIRKYFAIKSIFAMKYFELIIIFLRQNLVQYIFSFPIDLMNIGNQGTI